MQQNQHLAGCCSISAYPLNALVGSVGAFESLQRLGKSFDLVVVTSRQHAIQSVTLDWIDRHYPGIFQEVYFGNHWAVEGTPRKKSDICRAIGASVIIDDNVGYAVDCANAGIQVCVVGMGAPAQVYRCVCRRHGCACTSLQAYRYYRLHRCTDVCVVFCMGAPAHVHAMQAACSWCQLWKAMICHLESVRVRGWST